MAVSKSAGCRNDGALDGEIVVVLD